MMGTGQRRHVRITGPFEGYRVGVIDTPVRIYDISEDGCFVHSVLRAPASGSHFVLKIHLPDEKWICLKAEALYAKPDGFAVSFVDVPAEAYNRLRSGLVRLRGLLPESQKDHPMTLPSCPRCRGTSVTPIGMAGSTLPWFTCGMCDWVWAARSKTTDEETEITETSCSGTPTSKKQILIADDDSGVLTLLGKALSEYRLLAARDVSEACALGHGAAVDLLITDYLMPDGTGDELIDRIRQTHPGLKALMLTGHGAMLDLQGHGWRKGERVLAKPCSVADLRTAVTQLIGSP